MNSEPASRLISRTTILIICGVLAGIMSSVQIPLAQRFNVAASCLIGIVAFVAIDGSLQKRLPGPHRKLKETRETLNRRIEVQKAFLDSQVREMPDVAKELRLKQKREATDAAAKSASLDPATETC